MEVALKRHLENPPQRNKPAIPKQQKYAANNAIEELIAKMNPKTKVETLWSKLSKQEQEALSL
jgi:predicted oxidoreductase